MVAVNTYNRSRKDLQVPALLAETRRILRVVAIMGLQQGGSPSSMRHGVKSDEIYVRYDWSIEGCLEIRDEL